MSALDELLKQMANHADMAWNEETYDVPLAKTLTGAERTLYINKLKETARRGDTYAILTLAHLGATEAMPLLRAEAQSKDPWAQTARRALVILGKGTEVVNEVAKDARGPAKMGRVAAVMDLARIGGATAIAALEHALDDEDLTVRLLAWDGLVEVLGLKRHLQNPEGKRDLSTEVERLRVLLGSDLAPFVKLGADAMRKVSGQLRGGATPAALGIVWAPNPAPALFGKLRLALFDAEAVFPVDELEQLDGVPRRLAETLIALRLETQDARVPDALVRLDAVWVATALDEISRLPATPDDLREVLVDAARTLRAS